MNSSELKKLYKEREELLKALAPTLRRAGPNHPKRNEVNRQRTALRKKVQQKIHTLETEIINRVGALLNANKEIK